MTHKKPNEPQLVHQTVIGPVRSRIWRTTGQPNAKLTIQIDRIDSPDERGRISAKLDWIEAVMLKTALDEAMRASVRIKEGAKPINGKPFACFSAATGDA